MARREHTYYEIQSQPEVWKATLTRGAQIVPAIPSVGSDKLVVAGCGSTFYLALTLASIADHFGFDARAYPSTDYLNFPSRRQGSEIFLSVSRSGTTTETSWALDSFRQRNLKGHSIAITTQPKSRLALGVDYILDSPDAQEQSLAQTRSFTSMMLLGQLLLAEWACDREYAASLAVLPERLEQLVARMGDLPEQLGNATQLHRFFYLGSGPFYGLACEAMMKTKEMTGSWVEAYHSLEVRHGPMSLVDDETIVVGFISDAGREGELRVLRDLGRLGGVTVALIEDASSGNVARELDGISHVVELKSGLSDWARGALYLPFVQWLAFYRAVAKGLNPDQPRNLVAAIEL